MDGYYARLPKDNARKRAVRRRNDPKAEQQMTQLFEKATTTNDPLYTTIPGYSISIGTRLFAKSLPERERDNQYQQQAIVKYYYDNSTSTTNCNDLEITILSPLNELIVQPNSNIKFIAKQQILDYNQKRLQDLWRTCIKNIFVPNIIIPSKIQWKKIITGGNQNRLHNYINITIHAKNIEEFIKVGLNRWNTITKILPQLQRFQIKLHPRHQLETSTTNTMTTQQHNLKIEPSVSSYGKNNYCTEEEEESP